MSGADASSLAGCLNLRDRIPIWQAATRVGAAVGEDDAAAVAAGQPFVIGHDLDGGLLLMDPGNGALFTAEPGAALADLGMDLSQYLGVFRNELAMGKLEWADGWVSTA